MIHPDTSAVAEVLHIPELLELILLALPASTSHQEVSTIRIILLNRTMSKTWHDLIQASSPIRQLLYLPTPLDTHDNSWTTPTAFPPAQPNPWIPHLLLNQRSWGSAYPFNNDYSASNLEPSKPKLWTFSFEISRAQYQRFPSAGAWREMLVTQPPFTMFWFTRSFYELGSGRAPFVTYLDYDDEMARGKQRYVKRKEGGVTIGMVVDAIAELMEKHSDARFVLVEGPRVE